MKNQERTLMSMQKFPKIHTVLALSLLLLIFLCSSVLAASLEVENIRQQIRNKGAKWAADDTSISKLPIERRLKRVGLIKRTAAAGAGAGAGAVAGSVAGTVVNQSTQPVAPSGLAYLNYLDYNWITSIRDQGDCGSCWAFAATAALESQVLIYSGGSGSSSLNLSEETLISCCGSQVCGDCSGGYIESASNCIRNYGLPIENCFPYPFQDYPPVPPPVPACSQAACPYWWSGGTDAIQRWGWVTTDFWLYGATPPIKASVAKLKNALVYYGPLVVTMNVYKDFFSYSSGTYSYVGGPGNTYQGGHAVELIGYNDKRQCFIAKNSWGTGWGLSGYFKIAYSQVTDPNVQFGAESIAYIGFRPY